MHKHRAVCQRQLCAEEAMMTSAASVGNSAGPACHAVTTCDCVMADILWVCVGGVGGVGVGLVSVDW